MACSVFDGHFRDTPCVRVEYKSSARKESEPEISTEEDSRVRAELILADHETNLVTTRYTYLEEEGGIGYGSMFTLEILENGIWYTIESGAAYDLGGHALMAGTPVEKRDSLAVYGALDRGHYRIVRSFIPSDAAGMQDRGMTAVEFDW